MVPRGLKPFEIRTRKERCMGADRETTEGAGHLVVLEEERPTLSLLTPPLLLTLPPEEGDDSREMSKLLEPERFLTLQSVTCGNTG